MISNISAEMILGFIKYHGKKKVTLAEMFKSLSLEMGGDGKTITKKQLDDYIRKAETGIIKVSKSRLKALKKMQANWDKLSKDGNSINFADLKDFPMLLVNATVGDFEDSDNESKEKTDDLDKYKLDINDLKKIIGVAENSEITKSDVESYLQSILSEPSNDDSNSDLVDSLTNFVANFSINTTIETEV